MKKKIYNERETIIINECDNIIANSSYQDGLMKFMKLEEKYPEEEELIASKVCWFIKLNH